MAASSNLLSRVRRVRRYWLSLHLDFGSLLRRCCCLTNLTFSKNTGRFPASKPNSHTAHRLRQGPSQSQPLGRPPPSCVRRQSLCGLRPRQCLTLAPFDTAATPMWSRTSDRNEANCAGLESSLARLATGHALTRMQRQTRHRGLHGRHLTCARRAACGVRLYGCPWGRSCEA